MKSTTKEFLGLVTISTVLFLVLTNSAGFARAINAIGRNTATTIAALQGRS